MDRPRQVHGNEVGDRSQTGGNKPLHVHDAPAE